VIGLVLATPQVILNQLLGNDRHDCERAAQTRQEHCNPRIDPRELPADEGKIAFNPSGGGN
jgi:hypothetical protein